MSNRGIRELGSRARWMSWVAIVGAGGSAACQGAPPLPGEAASEAEENLAKSGSAIALAEPNDGTAPTVGVLAKGGKLRCTATQVSCNAVLTAAHCLSFATNDDEAAVGQEELTFELSDFGTQFRVLGYKSFGQGKGPDDVALARIEFGCGPDLMYPSLAANLPAADGLVKTWGASCDNPYMMMEMPDELPNVHLMGKSRPGSTIGKRFIQSQYRPAWPEQNEEVVGDMLYGYQGREAGHRYLHVFSCDGDSGGPTFDSGQIAFVASYHLMGTMSWKTADGTDKIHLRHHGTGQGEIPKWRAQILDKIAEWSAYCASGDSSGTYGSDSGSGSAGGSGSGSSCFAWSGSPASPPFTDDMSLGASGLSLGNEWLPLDGTGSAGTFPELCLLEESGTLGVGSECGDSGSGAGGYGSGWGYGDSGSGAGGYGSGWGYGDSGSGSSDSGSCCGSGYGGGYSDSGAGGAGGGQGDGGGG